MDMLDRYLQAVKFFLPAAAAGRHRSRTVGEPDLAGWRIAKQELGRPLDEAEQAAILREHGHPMLVAGRYRTRQHLIGPTFFPLYVFALKMGLAVALLVTMVLTVVTAALHGDPFRRLLEAMLAFPGRGLMVFAWTTLGFAALDFAHARFASCMTGIRGSSRRSSATEQQIPRLKTLCELSFVLARVVWLLLLPRSPLLILGPAAALVRVRARLARGVRADGAADAVPPRSCTSSTSFARIGRGPASWCASRSTSSGCSSSCSSPGPVICSFPEPPQPRPKASTSCASWRSSTRASVSEWRSPLSLRSSRSGEGCAGLNAGTARPCRPARPTHAPDAKTYVSSHDSRPRL